ncbi:uncharacterized protein LOC141851399 [Brevipalpus obovatus]|uniref:uncharacterized protein LOC141851399 n=1 Tax=Brevipalpus obovatus TaxID=246614 RepID=UPI003D9DEE8E
MGSKKHKKHKSERRSNHEDISSGNTSDQPRLKLVLKVGSSSSTSESNNFLSTSVPENNQLSIDQMNTSSDHIGGNKEDINMSGGNQIIGSSSSSGKKMKKKKKSKKHHKHSHSHRSHHSHHHHRHHRRSSCSHHSKSATTSTSHQHETSTSTSVISSVPVKPNNSGPPPIVDLEQPQPFPSSKSPQPVQHQRLPPCKLGNKQQFHQFLQQLLKVIQQRDKQSYFAWPVTENIAPGYSKYITHPMDFSTMRKKIDQNCYLVIDNFKQDIKLICDNAMRFNGPDTVYYKAARKLWHDAKRKIFTKSYILEMSKAYSEVSRVQLGLDSPDELPMEVDHNNFKSEENGVFGEDRSTSKFGQPSDIAEVQDVEMEHDEMSGDQILESVEKSAKVAAERLTKAKPLGSHLTFFRQREDGFTTLGIIGCPSSEKTVTIENLVGPLQSGHPSLPPYREPECNRAKPIESITSPPFSSYLPSIDSSNATLTQEETQLLTSTYGEDEIGLHYSQSLLSFASDNDYVMNMVSSLLEVLTQGKHSSTMHKLKDVQKEKKEKEKEKEKVMEKEKEKVKEKEKEVEKVKEKEKEKVKEKETEKEEEKETETEKEKEKEKVENDIPERQNEEDLKDKEKIGNGIQIDKHENDSILTSQNVKINPEDVDSSVNLDQNGLQGQLDHQSNLVNELQHLNNRRLASSTNPIPPGDDELSLANLLCEKLTQFISTNTTPGDITDPRAIRKALGVQIKSILFDSTTDFQNFSQNSMKTIEFRMKSSLLFLVFYYYFGFIESSSDENSNEVDNSPRKIAKRDTFTMPSIFRNVPPSMMMYQKRLEAKKKEQEELERRKKFQEEYLKRLPANQGFQQSMDSSEPHDDLEAKNERIKIEEQKRRDEEQRKQREEEQRRKQEEMEAEKRRQEEIERQKVVQEMEEERKRQQEAENRRQEMEAEKRRQEEIQRQKIVQEMEEERKRQQEAENRRQEMEAERRKQEEMEEFERQRIVKEMEEERKRKEEAERRKQQELEQRRLQEALQERRRKQEMERRRMEKEKEEERRRIKEAEERIRQRKLEEARRLAMEAERRRKLQEEEEEEEYRQAMAERRRQEQEYSRYFGNNGDWIPVQYINNCGCPGCLCGK